MAITTITNAMVSVNAIQGTLIADNAITAVHIATNAVSGTLIADNAVTATHIAQNTITVTQLADDSVEADKIADGVITTNHLNKAMISSQTEVTPVAGDFVLLGDTSDSNNLKKTLLSGIAALHTGAFSGPLSAVKLTATTGVLELDDDGSHNGVINSPASLRINIDSDDNSTGENFIVGQNQTAVNTSNELFKVHDSGYAEFAGASDVRVTFGSAGTAGSNSANWVRGESNYLAFNSAGSGFKYEVSGSEKMRLDSAGKLGIGTGNSDPDTQLHVKNTGGIELRLEADSNNNGQEDCFIRFYTDGKTQEGIAGMDNNNSSTLFSGNTENAMVFGTVSNLPVVLATNNTERWIVEAGGKFYGTGQIQGGTVIMGGSTISYGGDNYSAIGTNSSSARFGYFRDFSANYPAMLFNTADDAHFSPHDSGVQVYLGSQGGDFGGNSSHNVRAASNLFMLNAGSSNGQFVVEVNGSNRGSVTASTSFVTSSDERIKKDIVDMDKGLAEILQLKPKKFKYNIGTIDQYGFIAQEVEQIIPDLITESVSTEDGVEITDFKSLSYNGIFSILVKAVQEQDVVIQDLKAEVAALKG